MLATDVQGNEDGSGVLLDSDGNVAGMILKKNENDGDRKSTRLNSSHVSNSYAVFC